MRKIQIILSLAIFAYSFTGKAQSKNFIDQAYIETTAQVDSLVNPDRIYLSILILESDARGKTSVQGLELRMENTLKKIGVNTQDDLVLNDLASNFKKYFLRPQEIFKSKAYTLLVKDAQSAGRVIIELERIGISNVFLDRTEYSKIEELRIYLKSKAILKAQKQARSLTAPLQQRLGAAIQILDQSDHSLRPALSGSASGLRIRGSASVQNTRVAPADIDFEKIIVESIVLVKFKLEE